MSIPPPARILVVDDEVTLMNALCDTLRERGFEAEGFTTGSAALSALHEAKFDLVLSDLMMPDVDGITLLRAALDVDPDLVGIIMTGQGTVGTAVEAMKSGALDYILKPFKLSMMMPVLARALAVRRLRMENAELERRVNQYNAELEATNRELEAFSYSVSHDLRAPLRKLRAFSDLLLEDFAPQMPPEAQDVLARIGVSAQRMGQLIDDLLRFSRLSQQPLSKQAVNLEALVRETVNEITQETPNHTVVVRVGDLPTCVGDEALLRQAIGNLLSNAFKFTRQRENAEIEVGFHRQNEENVYYVRDNGAGFDMKYAPKLFGVFQRLHQPDEFEGTGIGLSIVQRIIHRHGGRVWANAAVDEGATFSFTLPDCDAPPG